MAQFPQSVLIYAIRLFMGEYFSKRTKICQFIESNLKISQEKKHSGLQALKL